MKYHNERSAIISSVQKPDGVALSKKLLFEISWLKTSEAAEYLRTSPAQIRNWVYQGKIKAHKLFDRSLRFKKSDLDLLLKKGDQEWV